MAPGPQPIPEATAAWAAHGADPAAVAELRTKAEGGLTAGWLATWQARPSAPAIVDADTTLTYEQLEAHTALIAGRLQGQGVRPGNRVLLSASASVDLIVAYLAVLRLGAVVVPANPAYLEAELGHVVRDAQPVLAIVDQADRGTWIRRANPRIIVISPGVDLPDSPATELDQALGRDPALMLYTSGTTGAAKGALLTHGNLVASAEALRLAWGWAPDDHLLLSLPLFHLHGLGVGLHGTLQAGASLTVMGGFNADAVLAAAGRAPATLFFGVPTMYHRLADHADTSRLHHLRLLVSGSAALAPSLFDRIAERTGHRVLERYGMTETVMNVSNPLTGERRPGTVGLALPGVEVRLSGERSSESSEGAIEVRGPNVFAGYLHRPDANAEAFTDDGWFRTGDIGATDELGYLRIVGRAKELIISGGFNIHPREIEECLLTYPSVAEVAVVGEPSAEWGEEVVAHVVLAPGAGPVAATELIGHVGERLASYKKPHKIVFLDKLPRNALGKVSKGKLPSARS